MKILFYILLAFFNQDAESIKKEIQSILLNTYSSYKKIEYELINADKLLKEKFEMVHDREIKRSGDICYLPIVIFDKNNQKSYSFMTIRVKLYKDVFILRTNKQRGELILPTDLNSQLMDISNNSANLITDISQMSNLRTRSFIKEGTLLKKEHLEQIPIVKAGDKVIAFHSYKNVTIDFEVIAKQNGLAGDEITVVTLENKQYRAKIIDSLSVLIIK